jgi:hypothetical protein
VPRSRHLAAELFLVSHVQNGGGMLPAIPPLGEGSAIKRPARIARMLAVGGQRPGASRSYDLHLSRYAGLQLRLVALPPHNRTSTWPWRPATLTGVLTAIALPFLLGLLLEILPRPLNF